MATEEKVSTGAPVPADMPVPGLAVPAATTETFTWIPQNPSLYSRSENRRQTGPYESTVPAHISGWSPALTHELSADLEDATRALVEFDQHMARGLGAEGGSIGPMSAILLRTESASSSQIENLTASARQIALAEIGVGDSPNSRTVIGNVRAMEAAVALSDDISLETILVMHRELLQHQRGMEMHAGAIREELVWIGKGSAGPRHADFIAPQHGLVRPALQDLVAFATRADLPVLLQIAVAHAQFETIHPFVDGNGRTGRALVQALLRASGLTSYATVPLSAGLLTDTDGYFAALTEFRSGDAEPIARVFAQAARYAAHSGGALVDALAAQLQESRDRLQGLRRHAAAWKLLPYLVSQPVVDAAYVARVLETNPMTAQRVLQLLGERAVLVERTGKRRGRIWQHPGILEVLDEYADSIRRR